MNFEDNKDLFMEEARDLLTRIENGLVALEKRSGDPELVNDIFRGLHTIKGSGAMFGFQSVSDFTHNVENLFDEVRKGKLAVDSAIVDIGLRSIDCISLLLDGSDGGEERLKIIDDIEAIGRGQAAGGEKPGDEAPSIALPEKMAPLDGLPQVFRISFKPQPHILHRGIKIEALFRELEELGRCDFSASNDSLPALEKLDPTSLYLSWFITISTRANLNAVRAVFMFVEDYAELAIEAVGLQNGEGEAGLPKLGEILVSRGLIDEGEAAEIRVAQKPFGEVAVDSGKVRKEDVDSALAEQAIVRTANTEREARQESVTIRVKKEKLDSLIDLVGELVILQSILEQEAKKEGSGVFASLSESLARLSADLRDTTMSVRMVPLEESFANFQRLARDLSHQVGKELKLEVSGESTELDKNVIEMLKDPLVHIIRNSVDHGIEAPEVRKKSGKPPVGTIAIDARQAGARVEIAISDDGAGLDLERIRARAIERRLLDPKETDKDRIKAMIFEPGFSTAEKTTGISGRGVGMDVVKRNIEKLRGEVTLKSEFGVGMTVTLSIPLTLVIIEGLLVRMAGHDYVVTLSQVEECVDMTESTCGGTNEESIINLRGKTIPIVSLRDSLGIGGCYEGLSRLVIVSNEGSTVGLIVDSVVGRKQVVIKPLSSAIRRIKAISGATILGDGSVALILDIAEIVKTKLGR